MIGVAVARSGGRKVEDEESGLLEFLAELELMTNGSNEMPNDRPAATPTQATITAQDLSQLGKPAKRAKTRKASIDGIPPLFGKPKNSTQRQKMELQYLRSKVHDLETELQTVKRKREGERANGLSKVGPDCVMESLARRHLKDRIESENEHARLQATVQKQEKLLSSIKKLLSRRQTWDNIKRVEWRDGEEPSQQDMAIFSELMQGIDSRVPLLEAALGSRSIYWSPNLTVILKHAGATDMCFESKYSKVVPFDYRVVDDVLWRCARTGGLATGGDRQLVTLESADLVLLKHLVQHPPVVAEPSIVHQAFRRFAGVDCVYGIWEVVAEISGKAAGAQPFRLTSRGWGRVRAKKLQDGSTGSIIEELTTSTVTLLHSETSKRKRSGSMSREVDLFIQQLVSLWKEKHSMLHQLMENHLVDATIASKSTHN